MTGFMERIFGQKRKDTPPEPDKDAGGDMGMGGGEYDQDEKTQEIKREKTVLTPEELAERRALKLGHQHFGSERIDGMDNAYYNRVEQEKDNLAEARKKVEGVKEV